MLKLIRFYIRWFCNRNTDIFGVNFFFLAGVSFPIFSLWVNLFQQLSANLIRWFSKFSCFKNKESFLLNNLFFYSFIDLGNFLIAQIAFCLLKKEYHIFLLLILRDCCHHQGSALNDIVLNLRNIGEAFEELSEGVLQPFGSFLQIIVMHSDDKPNFLYSWKDQVVEETISDDPETAKGVLVTWAIDQQSRLRFCWAFEKVWNLSFRLWLFFTDLGPAVLFISIFDNVYYWFCIIFGSY